MILSSQWLKNKSNKNFKYLETNTKGNTVYRNEWDAAKAILRVRNDKHLY